MLNKKITLFDVVNIACLLLVATACIYPFINIVAISLSDGPSATAGRVYAWPVNFNTEAYKKVLSNANFGVIRGLLNSILYTTAGTLIAVAVTFLGSYSLSRKRLIGKKWFMMAIFFTMLFGGGMIPEFLLIQQLGMVNTIWAMIVPGAVSVWLLIITRSFLDTQPAELEESAFMDGANDIQIMSRVFVPLSKPVIATIALFYAVGIWNSYLTPIIYLRNPDLHPIQVVLYRYAIAPPLASSPMAPEEMGGVMVYPKNMQSAIVFMAMFPILLVYPFLQKYFTKGIYIGAIKG